MNIRKLLYGIIRPAVVGAAFCMALAGPVMAAEKPPADKWHFNLMLYGWLPSVDGTLQYGDPGSGTGASIDASTLIDDIQGIFMGGFEAGKGRWSFQGDVVYLDLADEKSDSVTVGPNAGGTITTGAQTELIGWLTHLTAAYNIIKAERGTLDLLFGTRYLSIDATIDLTLTGPLPPTLPGRHLSRSTDVLDGIIGIRGQVPLVGKLYLPYRLDVGAGSSQFSWQAVAGFAYRFNWGSLLLDYRHVSFDLDGDELLDTFSLSGPALGVVFSF